MAIPKPQQPPDSVKDDSLTTPLIIVAFFEKAKSEIAPGTSPGGIYCAIILLKAFLIY